MLARFVSILKKRLGVAKAQPLERSTRPENNSFDTLPQPWPIAQVEEEEDPRVE
ncbi:MAG TPA: hypothetical protein V6C63_02910 [Allocoleopsis sp.]